jgi:glutaredoxin
MIMWLVVVSILATMIVGAADSVVANDGRVLRLTVFIRNDNAECVAAVKYVETLARRRPGVQVDVRDVLQDEAALAEFWRLARLQQNAEPGLPAFHALDRFVMGFTDAASTGPTIDGLFDINIYSRTNCPHCQDAKKFLAGLERRWPAVRVKNHDLNTDANARTEMAEVARRGGITPSFVPVIAVGNNVLMGYQTDATTGHEIETVLERGAVASKVKATQQSRAFGVPLVGWFAMLGANIEPAPTADPTAKPATPAAKLASPPPAKLAIPPPAKLAPVPVPEPTATPSEAFDPEPQSPRGINVPGFGYLSVDAWGLPLFTFIIGLIDGFNPCAMWVLVFLLSVLVNVHDRMRMLAIAGTFVFVSGLAYFAFMAAWLNMFLLLGIERPLQIVLGCVALFIGAINVKDCFAFKRGISFSIPESAKPGIYERVRKIVATKYLSVALGLAVVLAIGVNTVELLCTAGLPALYTQILTHHELPAWQNYAYLGLYNVPYMFDDTLLLTTFVITLSHHKPQEREGKVLKFISGAVILLLGLAMLFRPEVLHWSPSGA